MNSGSEAGLSVDDSCARSDNVYGWIGVEFQTSLNHTVKLQAVASRMLSSTTAIFGGYAIGLPKIVS